jgi:hypothetical protein
MKTAVSLPDPLFAEAERVADRLGLSRSELYARAIARFVREHSGEAITNAINLALKRAPLALDPVLARIQAQSLGADEGSFSDWVGPRTTRKRSKKPRG